LQILLILNILSRSAKLIFQLFWIWITLDWKVRKARKAFEKELIHQGLPKECAKKLSRQIEYAKDQIIRSIWQSTGRKS
jgi:hypothetical protein